MTNLRSFYLENCSSDSYHYKWYKEIKENYCDENFNGDLVFKEDLELYDDKEVITIFKKMLYPGAALDFKNYVLLVFYLYYNDYIIVDFPDELKRPSDNFSESLRLYMIKNKIIDYEKLGKVPWKERKDFINELVIQKKELNHIYKEINKVFIDISTRSNSFNEMTIDEKLQEIANCLMRLIDKYSYPEFSEDIDEYISKNKISSLKGKLQCFRHPEEWALEKRKLISEEDKKTLIEVGILYINTYKDYLS